MDEKIKYIFFVFLGIIFHLIFLKGNLVEGLLVYVSGFGFTIGVLLLVLFYLSCPAIVIYSMISYYKK